MLTLPLPLAEATPTTLGVVLVVVRIAGAVAEALALGRYGGMEEASPTAPSPCGCPTLASTKYLLNQSPTQAVKKMTPKEACSRRKPRITPLRVFGLTVYVWIPNSKRSKLESKS